MKKLYLILALLALGGCTTTSTKMGLVIPEQNNINTSQLNNARVVKNVKGSDSAPILLFISLGQPSFEKAVQQAIDNGKGSALINATVSYSTDWYILFGYNKIEIDGDVVQINN